MKSKEFQIRANLVVITDLAFEVSTTTAHDVFVDYAGHVNSLSVRVHEGGWNRIKCECGEYKGKNADKNYMVYLNEDEENLLELLQEIMLELFDLRADRGVNYDETEKADSETENHYS